MIVPVWLKKICHTIGIDESIAYSSGARVVQAITGVVSILFIAQFLTKTEQGFYYTFGSIVALQVFFELGLTNIITQYVAHEASHLEWLDDETLKGERKYHSRLASLLHFSVRWYGIVSVLFLLVLVFSGCFFFNYYSPIDEKIEWFVPWILICVGAVANLFISPFLAILIGLNKVKEVSKIRFYQQCILPVISWIGLAVGLKLYVLGIASIVSIIYVSYYCWTTKLRKIVWNLWNIELSDKVNYVKEILPFQWKIAVSWMSGYFVLQLFNPVLFATSGATAAGQMGMTLSALTSISAFSQSWINTKIPLMSGLIAKKEYFALDKMFRTTLIQMICVCSGLLLIFYLAIECLALFKMPLRLRFLSNVPLLLMMIAIIISQYVNALATYLRCHKKEPMLVYSIVTGILCGGSTLFLGGQYGINGITWGYCSIVSLSSLWAYLIFEKSKKVWHAHSY